MAKRTYVRDNIKVFWDSEKCIHSGKCDSQLPHVFDPKRRPWVNLDAADIETIKRVIDTCPSGALSYEITEEEARIPQITVIKDGPYKVTGNCRLQKEGGELIETGHAFALCRCGATKKKPFCDGTHYCIHFSDE